MALASGTRLGSYEVVAKIGAGGMGEVYQAHDTKLGRDVAIKVLPEAFAHDPERLSRFQREAKMLAALNHPNIAAIFGLEHSDGVNIWSWSWFPATRYSNVSSVTARFLLKKRSPLRSRLRRR